MKRTLLASLCAGLLLLPASALATSPGLVRQYNHAYAAARHTFGPRAVGCNLTGRVGSCHFRATDSRLLQSLGVLHRLWAPPPAPVASTSSLTPSSTRYGTGYISARTTSSHPAYAAPVASSGGGGGSSGGSLASCIIRRESGGNPQATNGQYTGIAQWSPSAWAQDGGTKYAPTPTGASAAQQEAVLGSALANGQSGQWTPYDGC